MIVWLSVAAAIALVVAASVRLRRLHRHDRPPDRRPRAGDPHWGDWPPDQMSP